MLKFTLEQVFFKNLLRPNGYISGGRAIDRVNFKVKILSKRASYPRVGDSPTRPLDVGWHAFFISL
jgi:hypothetical protein